MEKEKLLAFFKEKNELVNENKAFTSFNLECINSFNFIVSNQKDKDGCSIKVESLKSLYLAVKDYYSNTTRNLKHTIIFRNNFEEGENMFVTPVLWCI